MSLEIGREGMGPEVEGMKTHNFDQEKNIDNTHLEEYEGVNELVLDYNMLLGGMSGEITQEQHEQVEHMIEQMEKMNPDEAKVMRKKAMDKGIAVEGEVA